MARLSRATLALGGLLCASPALAVPQDCSGTIVTGLTAVQAIPAQTYVHGFRIANLDTTEALWFRMDGAAAVVGATGSSPIASGTAATFAGAGAFATPDTLAPNAGLSLNATTAAHKYTCFYW